MERKWISREEAIELFGDSFDTAKVQRENSELHKTNAYLAEQARSVERGMNNKRWEKLG